jgi:NAD(P) transhydrogenase subunit alpha
VRVAVVAETQPGERRVAAVPETVGKLVALGATVDVEAGAGTPAFYSDADFSAKGAEIVVDRSSLLGNADVVVSVQPLRDDDVRRLRSGAAVISFLPPSANAELVKTLAERSITSYALDLVPRISRAQSMDALSSQALVAGYLVTLAAAERLPKFFPMFMTAAGTVPPAKVLVLGTGVAGLQVIATARRLGAVVEAYDVRSAARDEVHSLGAKFLELELETQEGEGGYARAQSEDFLAKQRELIGRHVQTSDVVITTAAVPGRRAPLLVTTAMVEGMRPGSVIVDLAAESGGNCELTQPGEDVVHGGVTIHGPRNVPSQMPRHASELFSRNVANLLALMVKDGELVPDFDDEILAGCCLTRGGEVVHPLATGAAS